MKSATKVILVSLVFAVLIMGSAWLFKHSAVGKTVNFVIYTVGFYLFFRYAIGLKGECGRKKA